MAEKVVVLTIKITGVCIIWPNGGLLLLVDLLHYHLEHPFQRLA